MFCVFKEWVAKKSIIQEVSEYKHRLADICSPPNVDAVPFIPLC